jgi:glucose-6-phosphate 1-dehydrogenase
MRVKLPGEHMEGEDVEMIAMHQSAAEMSPYERLLGDAMHGDASLFAREDAIEAQWKIVENILDNTTEVHEYDQNTWGPEAASSMFGDAVGWHDPAASAMDPGENSERRRQ